MNEEQVLLVRTTFDGEIICAWMPPILAVAEAGYHSDNGTIYYSCRIIADDTNMGLWDRSC